MTGGAVGFAFVLGMVALLNPCGLPLLPLYITAFVRGGDDGHVGRAMAGVRAGLALTTGFLAVFAVGGLLAGTLHVVLSGLAAWLMLGVGAAIVGVGVVTLCGRPLPVRLGLRFRAGSGFVSIFGFGVAYAVGSLNCSLPVFIAAVGGALASGSALVTMAVVVAYGLGMGLLATVLVLFVSFVGTVRMGRLRRMAAAMPRAAGALCILVGLYLTGYWLGQAGGPQLVTPMTKAVDVAQQQISGVIERAWLPIGVAAAAIVLATLLVAAQRTRHAVHETATGPDKPIGEETE